MNKSDCRLVGTLARLHGVKGKFILLSGSDLNEEIENWESVFLEIEGWLIPFFLDSVTITSNTSAIVGFEDIDSPEKAGQYLSCPVYQLKSLAGEEEDLSPEHLNGYKLIDQKTGLIGEIEEILDYSQNLLFRILKGKQEILIPVSDEIIVKVNHKKKEIIINTPEGLLDLYN